MNHDREVRCAWAAFVLASALYVAPVAALYRDDVPPPEVPTEPAPPKDNTPSCKDAYPYPYPYWIESSYMADVIERELKLNPQTSKVTFAIYANDPSEAIGVDVEFPAFIGPDEAVIYLDTAESGQRRAVGINRAANCAEAFNLLVPAGRRSSAILIKQSDVSWLELRRPYLSDWNTTFRWTDHDFWRAFGGRRVTIRWFGGK